MLQQDIRTCFSFSSRTKMKWVELIKCSMESTTEYQIKKSVHCRIYNDKIKMDNITMNVICAKGQDKHACNL